MKMSEVEKQADGRKGTFFYIADDRVDFRELIKLYAGEFRLKVEMRQIGARQEAAKVGGIGSCGRELCCSTWLSDFKSVNTTAAGYQNLSINQSKLSGQCGRLKCCLNYELDTYLDALQGFPDNAETLQVAKGTAILIKKDIFKNLMWYVLPDSNKQYPLTIERVRKIRQQNMQNIVPDGLEPVEVTTGKPKEAEESGFVDLVGQISLRTLEKADRKKKHGHHKREAQRSNAGSGNRDGGSNRDGGGNRGGADRGGADRGGSGNPGKPPAGGPPAGSPPAGGPPAGSPPSGGGDGKRGGGGRRREGARADKKFVKSCKPAQLRKEWLVILCTKSFYSKNLKIMALFQSSNPTLSEKIFSRSIDPASTEVMTVKGAIQKFGFLLLLVLAGAAYTWKLYFSFKVPTMMTLFYVGMIGGLICVFAISFKPNLAKYLSPAYAVLEGFVLGGLSALVNDMFKKSYPNIVFTAVFFTLKAAFATFLFF